MPLLANLFVPSVLCLVGTLGWGALLSSEGGGRVGRNLCVKGKPKGDCLNGLDKDGVSPRGLRDTIATPQKTNAQEVVLQVSQLCEKQPSLRRATVYSAGYELAMMGDKPFERPAGASAKEERPIEYPDVWVSCLCGPGWRIPPSMALAKLETL